MRREKEKMKFGEKFTQTLKNSMSGETFTVQATYKYASWGGYHTDNEGCGLWDEYHQILGTCDFSVAGCQTEKAAKAKIRKRVATF